MKEAVIITPDKETCKRLRILVNIVFPEAEVVCVPSCPRDSEERLVDLYRSRCTASRTNGQSQW